MRKPIFKIVNKNNGSFAIHHNSPYYLTYNKGEVVTAREETLGIFCFKRKRDAKDYMELIRMFNNNKNVRIIKVLPIGKGKKMDEFYNISAFVIKRLLDDFYKNKPISTRPATYGTYCYPSVKVL